MKKIFTLAALLATCWCSSSAAVYTDVINYANVLEQNDNAIQAGLDDRFDHPENINPELYYYSAESFTSYTLKNVFTINQTNEYITQSTLLFRGDEAGLYNVIAPQGKWLKSVTVNGAREFSQMVQFFYSSEAFSYADRWNSNVTYKYSYMQGGTTSLTFEIEEPVQYFYFICNDEYTNDITVEWTDEKPVPTVATPTIGCWAEPLCAGSYVEIDTETIGATVEVKVAINGVDDGETRTFTKTYDYMVAGGFNLPGKTGDVITVTAVAKKADWADSEVATETYTLAEPPCPEVVLNNNYEGSYLYLPSGKPIKLAVVMQNENGEYVDVEGAKITYSYTWNNWDAGTSGASDGETTVDAPYELTLPADVPTGAYLSFTFKQVAPGYSESECYRSAELISSKIAVPTLNTTAYTDVEKGTAMTLNKPRFADKLYYTINGGEEQMTENWAYEFTVEEDMTLEAWATGEGFEPSDKVTFEITLENLDANIDVILPLDNEQSSSAQYYFDGDEHNGANKYLFNGGFWYVEWPSYRSTFYYNNSYTNCDFLANTTAGEYVITGIRIDSPDNGCCAAVYLADEPLATADESGNVYRAQGVESNYPNYSVDGRPGYFMVCSPDYVNLDSDEALRAGGFNEWIDIKTAQAAQIDGGYITEDETERSFENRKYFLIRPWGNNGLVVYRYLIRYSSDPTGVTAINADLDTEAQAVYYNLNGVRVDGQLAPGLYIRVTPASTTKVLVK